MAPDHFHTLRILTHDSLYAIQRVVPTAPSTSSNNSTSTSLPHDQTTQKQQSKRKRFIASPSLPPSPAHQRNSFQLKWTSDIDYAPRITPSLQQLPPPPAPPAASTSTDTFLTPSPRPPILLNFHQPYSLYDPRRQRIPSPLPAPSSHQSSPGITPPALPLPNGDVPPPPTDRSRRGGGQGGRKRGGKGGRRSAKEKERDSLTMPPPPPPPLVPQFIPVHPATTSTTATYLSPADIPGAPKKRRARAKNHQPHAPSPLGMDAVLEPEQLVPVAPPPARRSRKRKLSPALQEEEQTPVVWVSPTNGHAGMQDLGVEPPPKKRRTRKPKGENPTPRRRGSKNTVPSEESEPLLPPVDSLTTNDNEHVEEEQPSDPPPPTIITAEEQPISTPIPDENTVQASSPAAEIKEPEKTPAQEPKVLEEHSPSSPVTFPITPPSPSIIRPTILIEAEKGLPFNTGLVHLALRKATATADTQNVIIAVPYEVPIHAHA